MAHVERQRVERVNSFSHVIKASDEDIQWLYGLDEGADLDDIVKAWIGDTGRHVFVELPGGTLEITWPGDQSPVTMAGPTAFVFEGDFLLEQAE